MTPFKNFSKDTPWKNRVRRGSLYVAVAAVLAGAPGCGSDNGADWEEVTVQEPTKGVVTTLEETEPGQFSIVDEQVVSVRDSSLVIIKRLDGSTERLTLEQAKTMAPPDGNNPQQYNHHSHGLSNVLWWSAMGYMIGRNFGTPVNPAFYRNGGFYRSSQVSGELQRTAVSRIMMRPVNGKSGFFNGSSRGRSHGG